MLIAAREWEFGLGESFSDGSEGRVQNLESVSAEQLDGHLSCGCGCCDRCGSSRSCCSLSWCRGGWWRWSINYVIASRCNDWWLSENFTDFNTFECKVDEIAFKGKSISAGENFDVLGIVVVSAELAGRGNGAGDFEHSVDDGDGNAVLIAAREWEFGLGESYSDGSEGRVQNLESVSAEQLDGHLSCGCGCCGGISWQWTTHTT